MQVIRAYDKDNVIYEADTCQDCNKVLGKDKVIMEGMIYGKKLNFRLCKRCANRKGIIERLREDDL